MESRACGGARAGVRVHASDWVSEPELSVLGVCEQAPNQRVKFLVRQRCKLQQAGVQPLELAFGQGVKVDATNALLDTRALQPTEENLGSAGIGDSALS